MDKTREVIPELSYLDVIAKTFRQIIQYQSILIGIIALSRLVCPKYTGEGRVFPSLKKPFYTK